MTVKYFNVKNGLSTGNISLDATSGNISGTNLSVTGNSNLGAVGNVNITGGASGYFLSTDGNGTLSFVSPSSASNPAPMPIVVETGTTLTIANNYQGLFGYPLTIDGSLVVDGILIDVNDNGNGVGGSGESTPTALSASIANITITGGENGYYLQTDGTGNLSWAAGSGGGGGGSPGGSSSHVQYNNSGSFAGSSSFTFTSATSTLNVGNVAVTNNLSTGNITVTGVITGNIVPSANSMYSLGNSTNKFANLYLAGNTISLANSTISSNATTVTIVSPDAASLQLSSNSNLANSVTANYFIGSGNNLSNIQGANVNGYVGYAAIAYSVAGSNVIGAVSSATYASIANSVNASNIVGTVSSASVAATVSASSQPNITSVGTLVNLDVTGNLVVGGNLTVNGTTTTINSTVVQVDDLAIILANDASTSSQANGAGIIINGADSSMLYINSTNSFTFSHKISADGGLLSNIAGGNVSGTVSAATTAGTVTTAAQPNITSVGTLSSVTVSGTSTLGAIGNVKITGGSADQTVLTDGAGNLRYASPESYILSPFLLMGA